MKLGTRTTWIIGLCSAFAVACGTSPQRPDDKPVAAAGGGGQVVETKGPEISVEAQEAFQRAVAAYSQQKKSGRFDYDDLLQGFKEALDKDPKLAEAHYNLGAIYEAMREDEQAVEHYKQALQIRPDLTLASANLGAVLARRGKLDQALELYKQALQRDATNSAVLLNIASIYTEKKQYEAAIKTASKVLVRDPSNIGAYRVMASVYYGMGDMDMARLICMRGLVVKPNDPSLLNTFGLALLRLKRVPEALAQFRLALEQRPDMVPTRFNIAKIAMDYKDFRVAKDEFTRILQYDPSSRQAAIGLGIAMRGIGEVDAAKAQFKALSEKDKSDPVPHQWLCRLELRNFNNPTEAKSECKACVKLYGTDLPGDHPCVAMYKEANQTIEMDKKMKVAEQKAIEEQKKFEEKLVRLAQLRKETVEKAWARAEAEGDVLPPSKLEGDKLEFVLDPLAVTPDKNTPVKLVGAIFKDIKKIELGQVKLKWRQLEEHIIEVIVPKGLDLGAWDILITTKDGGEMYFQGGLWIGKKPEKKPEGKPDEAKPGTGAPAPGEGGSGPAGEPGAEPAAPSGEPSEPGDVKAPEEKPAGPAAPATDDKPAAGTGGGEPKEPEEPAGP